MLWLVDAIGEIRIASCYKSSGRRVESERRAYLNSSKITAAVPGVAQLWAGFEAGSDSGNSRAWDNEATFEFESTGSPRKLDVIGISSTIDLRSDAVPD
ncbi:MAG TPA: hypothetical protein DDW52_21275 [Planctomycetaceae bacterium]|nr:hypothetical protein [Planctomycetaceae bacterium]